MGTSSKARAGARKVSSAVPRSDHPRERDSPRISSSSPFESYSSPMLTSLSPFLPPPAPPFLAPPVVCPSCPFQIELDALASPVSPRGASVAACHDVMKRRRRHQLSFDSVLTRDHDARRKER